MTAATITGTTHAASLRGVDGADLRSPTDTCTIEVGGGGLTATVLITPGQPVEVAPCTNQDVVTGGWVTYNPGQSFELGPGDRRVARMVGIGGAGIRVQFHGDEQLAALRAYEGKRGQGTGEPTP